MAEAECVLEAVGRDVGKRRCDVGHEVQVLVEAVQTREDVAQDVDVGRGADLRGVEVPDLLGDGEAQRLVGCKLLRRTASAERA